MNELGTVALGALIIAVVSLTVAAVAFVMWYRYSTDEAVDGILAFAVALALGVGIMATVVAAGAGLLRAYAWMMLALEVGI